MVTSRLTAVVACAVLGANAFAGQTQVPSTLADFFIKGTQPGSLTDALVHSSMGPGDACRQCHAGTNAAAEQQRPYKRWAASVMGQASRDPIFWAVLDIANADANGSGDLCLRCHVPVGWLQLTDAGVPRCVPTDGRSLVIPNDLDGVSCSICHRMINPLTDGGQPLPGEPAEDGGELTALGANAPAVFANVHNASYVVDRSDRRRAQYPDASPHGALTAAFFREKNAILCGTCHDVSNPVYERNAAGEYILCPCDLGQPHSTGDKHKMFPIERTYSEWRTSEFAIHNVNMGGRFDPANPNVGLCQDCHMPKVAGAACGGGPQQTDLGQHSFNGVNSWILKAVRSLYPDKETGLTEQAVNDSIARTTQVLEWASDMDLVQAGNKLRVRLTNHGGHKLPSGYPEGRRMWLNVKFLNGGGDTISESGAYEPSTAVLTMDPDIKIYEATLGIDQAVADLTGANEGLAGETFHFVLNNVYLKDNRIPPRGFTNAAADATQTAPVSYFYADGQFWDETLYTIPANAVKAQVTFYSQTTTKEYIEFVKNNAPQPGPGSRGQIAYNQWVIHGKSAPVVLDTGSLDLTAPVAGNRLYVDDTAEGNNDGSDWENAFVDLQSALAIAVAGDEVWVAEGLYFPTAGADRTISFSIPFRVAVYGGFDATEDELDDRAGLFEETILDGDIGFVAAGGTDNSYHVVRFDCPDESTILDGFQIRNGYADGGGADSTGAGVLVNPCGAGPTIRNVTITSNSAAAEGGGMAVAATGMGQMSIRESKFISNFAGTTGGGLNNAMQGVVTLVNCAFNGNGALAGPGGGIHNGAGTYLRVINCTVTGNVATIGGGVKSAGNGTLLLSNSILRGNSIWVATLGVAGIELSADADTALFVNYCDIGGGLPPELGGTGNIDADPEFEDVDGADNTPGTLDDDLGLAAGSPCIDSGHSNAVPADVEVDLALEDRFHDDADTADTGAGTSPRVDMGAFEFQFRSCPADLDKNATVDVVDLLILLAKWNTPDSFADIDGSGLVDVTDLILLLAAWGPCP